MAELSSTGWPGSAECGVSQRVCSLGEDIEARCVVQPLNVSRAGGPGAGLAGRAVGSVALLLPDCMSTLGLSFPICQMEVIRIPSRMRPQRIRQIMRVACERWPATWPVSAGNVFMWTDSSVLIEPHGHMSHAPHPPPGLSLVHTWVHTWGLLEGVRWVHSGFKPSPSIAHGSPLGGSTRNLRKEGWGRGSGGCRVGTDSGLHCPSARCSPALCGLCDFGHMTVLFPL